MSLSIEDQVIVALRRITRAIDLRSRGLLHEYGLTAPQLAALKSIGKLQPVTIGGLARSIHLSQATLTGIVSRLEKRGLAVRERSGVDRRSVVVSLTDTGRELVDTAPSLLQDHFRDELLQLEEWEQNMLLASLQRIASMMDAEGIDAAPVLTAGAVSATAEEVSRVIQTPGLSEPEQAVTDAAVVQ